MDRTRWEYTDGDPSVLGRKGTFTNTNDKQWENTNAYNTVYYFTETARTESYVELYDQSRRMYVRLTESGMLWRVEGEYSWKNHPIISCRWFSNLSY